MQQNSIANINCDIQEQDSTLSQGRWLWLDVQVMALVGWDRVGQLVRREQRHTTAIPCPLTVTIQSPIDEKQILVQMRPMHHIRTLEDLDQNDAIIHQSQLADEWQSLIVLMHRYVLWMISPGRREWLKDCKIHAIAFTTWHYYAPRITWTRRGKAVDSHQQSSRTRNLAVDTDV
jgi:hypothetical protein